MGISDQAPIETGRDQNEVVELVNAACYVQRNYVSMGLLGNRVGSIIPETILATRNPVLPEP
jgi:hypothetical protein